MRQISQVLPGGQYPVVLVLADPRNTGTISYAADGRTFIAAERLKATDRQPGLALFLRTGPATGQQVTDLIELRDAGGGTVYRGPIDTGASSPDV